MVGPVTGFMFILDWDEALIDLVLHNIAYNMYRMSFICLLCYIQCLTFPSEF